MFAGSLHVVFGLNADASLGAEISAQTLIDPSLDSQNRFYGGAFLLYGVLLLVIAANLEKYAFILKCLLWVFLVAGLARFISVALYGWPAPLVTVLFIAELVFPPVLLVWLAKLQSIPTTN